MKINNNKHQFHYYMQASKNQCYIGMTIMRNKIIAFWFIHNIVSKKKSSSYFIIILRHRSLTHLFFVNLNIFPYLRSRIHDWKNETPWKKRKKMREKDKRGKNAEYITEGRGENI